MGTLGLFAQSPRFLFYADSIVLKHSPKVADHDFEVYKGELTNSSSIDKNPILGEFTRYKDRKLFVPIIPFQKGELYSVVSHENVYTFKIEHPKSYEPLTILNVFPNTETLPANFLKFYIAFSRPVNPTKVYDHIKILDNAGKEVERAILPLENALLSPDGTLLTIWIEPGRQKRELGPNRMLGGVLKEGTVYTLLIDNQLKDQNGQTIAQEYQKSYTIVSPDRNRPSLENWKLVLPKLKTQNRLIIKFGEPMDYGSLVDNFEIRKKDGKRIDGSYVYSEKQLVFNPKEPWKSGFYTVNIKPLIEDLSGNNLERLFDQDINKKNPKPNTVINFNIRD